MTSRGAQLGEHAVVLGASMAGLLAARVLAGHYPAVTVIDRDAMPQVRVNRRGVPQGRHLHALLPRGREILEELFSGFSDELTRDGAVLSDMLGSNRVILSGHRFAQAPAELPNILASRPFFEDHVRTRVTALPQVRIAGKRAAGRPVTGDDGRVTGVTVQPVDGGAAETLPADLVIDATGRGSRLPVWLTELGYPRPDEDRVDIDLGYATRTYRLRPGALGHDDFVLIGAIPERPRGGALSAIEGGLHMVTLFGILGDHPPVHPAGFAAFAASLPAPDIAEALHGAEPVHGPARYRFPASLRRRYERLGRWPDGLLAAGDAVCSVNPIYGQGMTVACLHALTLRDALADGTAPPPGRYFAEIATASDAPWNIAVGADLAFPGVAGDRPADAEAAIAYVSQLHAAAETDPVLGQAFLRVTGMLDPPQALLRPEIQRLVDRGSDALLVGAGRPVQKIR